MATRFNDHRRIERLTQTSLMEPAGVMADGESDASKILFGAMDTVERILKERAQLDREGRADEPLVVVIGENHDFPSHHLHNLLVLKALNDSDETTVVGMEQRRSNVRNWLKHGKGYNENDHALHATFDSVDADGRMSLSDQLLHGKVENAPYSQKVLQSQILEMGIPVRFTDAAFQYKPTDDGHVEVPILDADAPKTAQSIADCWVERGKEFDAFSPDGIWIRNHHAAAQIKEFAAEQGARIVIQMSGNAHVLGQTHSSNEKHLPGHDSLARNVKDLGLPVLAVSIHNSSFRQTELPKDHKLDPQREMMSVRELPSFKYQAKSTSFDDIFESPEQRRVDEDMADIGFAHATITQDSPQWDNAAKGLKQLLKDFDKTYQANLADHATKFWVGVGDLEDDQPDALDGQDFE